MTYRLPQNMVFIHSSRHLHVAATARMAKCPCPRPRAMWPLHSYSCICDCSVLLPFRFTIHHFRMFHHFRIHVRILHLLGSLISGNFRHSIIFGYSITSLTTSGFSVFYVLSFPEISVIHVSSFPDFSVSHFGRPGRV